MSQLRLFLFLLCSSVLGFSALELAEGISRAELEQLVGKPLSVLQRGEKTVLMYPNRGRAELVAGRLVYFERIEALNTPAATAPAAAPAPALPTPAAPIVPAAAPVASPAAPVAGASSSTVPTASADAVVRGPAPAVAAKAAAIPASTTKPGPAPATASVAAGAPAAKSVPGGAVLSASPEDDPAYAKLTPEERERLKKHEAEIAVMQEKFLNGEPLSTPKEDPLSSSNPWVVMLLQALLSLPVTVVVLKYAFKWCDVDADWSQMWLPALVDTVVRGAVQGTAEALWGVDTLFYLDEGLAFFALLFVLIKTTHACTAARAIGVAFAAKFVGIVVWAILSVFILGLLFSRANS